MRVAAHEARMRAPDAKGVATRVHYEGRAKRAALAHGEDSPQHEKALAIIDGPDVPDELQYLWGWFHELDRTRTVGMNGPEALTYQAIDAWARLTGRAPDALEVDALLQLDIITRHPDALPDDADG